VQYSEAGIKFLKSEENIQELGNFLPNSSTCLSQRCDINNLEKPSHNNDGEHSDNHKILICLIEGRGWS
jgi:hypothetical protein